MDSSSILVADRATGVARGGFAVHIKQLSRVHMTAVGENNKKNIQIKY